MAITISVYNQEAKTVGELTLPARVFGLKVNPALVHQVLTAHRANARQTLAHTLTKAEVRGGGRKPWRQKGTGRARAGSSRSPIWVGGGVVFGPRKDRNFTKGINKQMNTQAIRMALSDKVADKKLVVLDALSAAEYKTKTMHALLSRLETAALGAGKKTKRNVLIVTDVKEEKIKHSCRNLEGVKLINLENLNLVDLVTFRDLVLTKAGAEALGKKSEKKGEKKS